METYQTILLHITAFSEDITILNQRIIYKENIEFVTEFPCLLGHPVASTVYSIQYTLYSVHCTNNEIVLF